MEIDVTQDCIIHCGDCKTKESYNLTALKYAQKVQGLMPIQEMEKFINLLPSRAKILDIGSGPGRDAKVFGEKGLSVIGIDFSTSMIQPANDSTHLKELPS